MPDAIDIYAETPVYHEPHSEEAEQALLGAILVDNRAYTLVADILRPEHFYSPVHGRIFSAVSTFVERGQSASPVTLRPYFDRDDSLKDVGGPAYLGDLAASVIGISTAPDYAHAIRDLFMRRTLIAMAKAVIENAAAPTIEMSAYDIMDSIERDVSGLSDDAPRAKTVISLKTATATAIEQIDAARRRGDGLTGVTTGLKDLDWRTGGLVKGELTVIAARPGMGKSDLAFNIGVNSARAGFGVLVFSQEMTAPALAMRHLARDTSIPASEQRLGRVDDAGFVAIMGVQSDIPIHIDETPAVTAEHIARVVRRLRQRKRKVDLVIVDHIQLMTATGLTRINETALVTDISGKLKGLSKSLDVAVLALSQLNRSVEQRDDKRPMLADLRSSGSIEQDADAVWTLYRDEYYAMKEEPQRKQDESDEKFNSRYENWERRCSDNKNIAEISCLKLRCGMPGTVTAFYDAARSMFADLERT